MQIVQNNQNSLEIYIWKKKNKNKNNLEILQEHLF